MNRKLNGLVILVEFVIAGGILFWLSYIPGYDIQRWELSWDGVPEDMIEKSFGEVTCLEMAPNGDIWGCTDRGLIHYDGCQWEYIATEELRHVYDLVIPSDGQIWALNTQDKLFYYNGDEWYEETYFPEVNGITKSNSGHLWLLSEKELFERVGNQWTSKKDLEDDLKSFYSNYLEFAPDDSIWIIGSSELIKLTNSNEVVDGGDELHVWLINLTVSENGDVWTYGTWPKASVFSLSHFTGKHWIEKDYRKISIDDYSNFFVSEMDADPSGNVWLATTYGLCHFDDWRCTSYFLGEETYSITVLPDESLLVGFKNGVALMKK